MENKKELTYTTQVLLSLFYVFELVPRPFEGKTAYFKRQLSGKMPYRTYLNILNKLEDKGWIKIYAEKKKKAIKLNKEGILEALFIKAQITTREDWDKKWRIVIFDIPEECKEKRQLLRKLLKVNGFTALQQSVYINPYPLNREAVRYLNESGLKRYIRILRVDEMDEDKSLKIKYNLS